MTTALYYLRAKQVGLTFEELENLEEGFVIDMFIEKSNDQHTYQEVATQSDFDKF